MSKWQYLFSERSLNSIATEYEHGEDGSLPDSDQATTAIHDKKKFLRTYVVPVLRTWAC